MKPFTSIVFLFLYLHYLLFVSSQDYQLNLNSNNILYQGVIKSAIEYISTVAIEIHPIALFVHHQSYNSIYRVILGKQVTGSTIQIVEIKIFTGKNTSGRNDVFYNEILNDFAILHFIQPSYLSIQQAAEKYLKEDNKTLKYLQSIEINNSQIFFIRPVIKEDGEYVLVGNQWSDDNGEEASQGCIITGMFKLFKEER